MSKAKRSTVIAVTVSAWLIPSSAGAAPRHWTQPPGLEDSQLCIDQNSIVKRADGFTQYEQLALCEPSKSFVPSDDWIMVFEVQCDEDMSADHFAVKERTAKPAKDGQYGWTEHDLDSRSAGALFAKYACHKG